MRNSSLPVANDTSDSLECTTESGGNDVLLFTFITLYIFIILGSVIGNLLMVLVVITRVKMQTFTHILICNCALADLLITLFSAVLGVVDTLITKGRWYLGSFMCSFVHFCVIACVAANMITLMVITVERLTSVISPYKKVFKNSMLRFIIPVVWLVAFAFASPATFSQGVVEVAEHGVECVEQWLPPFKRNDSPKHYTIILFVCLYALPLTLMFSIYIVIARKLGYSLNMSFRIARFFSRAYPSPPENETLAQRGEITDGQVVDSNNTKRFDHPATLPFQPTTRQTSFQKGKVIRMLVLMLLVFAICWLPVYLLQFLTFFHPYYSKCRDSIPDWAYATSYFMQYANSAIDPLLYFWFSSHFRKELKGFMRGTVVCLSGRTSEGRS